MIVFSNLYAKYATRIPEIQGPGGTPFTAEDFVPKKIIILDIFCTQMCLIQVKNTWYQIWV